MIIIIISILFILSVIYRYYHKEPFISSNNNHILNNIKCPSGWKQKGKLGADIPGCGLEKCESRYGNSAKNIHMCSIHCKNNHKCSAFTWAPINGDKNHKDKSVCTIYSNNKYRGDMWKGVNGKYTQILCEKNSSKNTTLSSNYNWVKTPSVACIFSFDVKYSNTNNVNGCKNMCLHRPDKCLHGFSYHPKNNQCRFSKSILKPCSKALDSSANYYNKTLKPPNKSYCPDPKYMEYNPSTCYSPLTKNTCSKTPKPGYIANDNKCKQLFDVSKFNYNNDEFFSLIWEAYIISKHISKKPSNKHVQYNLSKMEHYMKNLHYLACVTKSNRTNTGKDKCMAVLLSKKYNYAKSYKWFNMIEYMSAICKENKPSEKSICKKFTKILTLLISLARNIRYNNNAQYSFCHFNIPNNNYSKYNLFKQTPC